MLLVASRFSLCVVFAGHLAAFGVRLMPRLVLLCFWVLLVLLIGWVAVRASLHKNSKGNFRQKFVGATLVRATLVNWFKTGPLI